MIVSKETGRKTNQMQHSFAGNKGYDEHLKMNQFLNKQNQLQDDHHSLKLSQLQNQCYIQNQVKDNIQKNYMEHYRVNEYEDSQNEVQNQNEEEKHMRMDFYQNKDGSYFQMWK